MEYAWVPWANFDSVQYLLLMVCMSTSEVRRSKVSIWQKFIMGVTLQPIPIISWTVIVIIRHVFLLTINGLISKVDSSYFC